MSGPYLYEFLYRGRPEGDPQPPSWHVVIGQHNAVPGTDEQQFVSGPPLNPAQAEAAGFPLDKVLEGVNAAALSLAASPAVTPARILAAAKALENSGNLSIEDLARQVLQAAYSAA